MLYQLGDNVILQDIEFEEYNGKVFTIVDIVLDGIYQVSRDGFDPVWVTENNFV